MNSSRTKLPEKKKIMIAIIASVVFIAAVLGAVLSTTGEVSAYSQKLKTAEQYVAEGDLDAAEIQYKELINLDPKRETAYIELAKEVYFKQNRYDEAYAILDLGLRNTGKDRIFKETREWITEEQKNSEEWKTAYRKILEENVTGIDNYEFAEYAGMDQRKGTALCDLNEDGVEELLFFTLEEQCIEKLHIYTYQDGKAREITYTWDDGLADDGEGAADRMQIGQVAGGSDYIVYKEKDQKGFTTYSNSSDETIDCTLNRYEMDASCKTDRISLLGMWFLLFDVDNNGEYGPDYATYYKDKKQCSREEYHEIVDPSMENIETVIFRFYYDEDSGAEYYDHPTMWKNTKGKEISLYYEDMISKLEVAQTEEPPEDNSGMSEDGKNMEALLKAYGSGDYETAKEINKKLPKFVSEMSVSEEESEAYENLYDDMVGRDMASEYTVHYITDIDKDGKSEYLLQVGTCEADYMLEVHQYRDGKTNKVGEIGFGHSSISQYPDHNGIIIEWGHMGSEGLSILSIENGALKQTEVGGRGSGELQVEEYIGPGCALDCYEQ